ncbi:MAG: hypothetical protein ACREU9_10905, partial [Gammaproteobacteria bacterium]
MFPHDEYSCVLRVESRRDPLKQIRLDSGEEVKQKIGYKFFHRDIFAFGKEVWSAIWLRPEAALGIINALFWQKYYWARELPS